VGNALQRGPGHGKAARELGQASGRVLPRHRAPDRSLVPTFIWAQSTEDPVTGDPADGPLLLFGFLLFIAPSLYQWLMLGARGATLGKLAVGIAVVRGEDAGRLGFARAAGRVASIFLLGILCYVPGILSYLWPLWDRRNQALHDKMVNSIVVWERS
jgi:uncharacterized RDD family membrane protein YckC